MKILIIGHAGHGKDTVAEFLGVQLGMKFSSSSQFCAKKFIFESLKSKYGYNTPNECFVDRVNHRSEWYQMIRDYNSPELDKLATELLEVNDIYVGMRDLNELKTCIWNNRFDLIIWVDASERLPLESEDSMKIDKSYAHIIIDNNSDESSLKRKLIYLSDCLRNSV